MVSGKIQLGRMLVQIPYNVTTYHNMLMENEMKVFSGDAYVVWGIFTKGCSPHPFFWFGGDSFNGGHLKMKFGVKEQIAS